MSVRLNKLTNLSDQGGPWTSDNASILAATLLNECTSSGTSIIIIIPNVLLSSLPWMGGHRKCLKELQATRTNFYSLVGECALGVIHTPTKLCALLYYNA